MRGMFPSFKVRHSCIKEVISVRRIPNARSGQWWKIAGLSAAIYTLLLWLIRFVVLDQAFTVDYAFRFMVLAVALALVSSTAGWLGARLLWICSTAGILLGMIAMAAMVARDLSGWGDLIGLLIFLELAAAGYAAGLIAEAIRVCIKLWRRRKR